MKKSCCEKFWRRWIEADYMKRVELLDIVVSGLRSSFEFCDIIKDKLDKENSKRVETGVLNMYLEDLYETACKVEREKNKKVEK
jgi:hypothetical protein